mgnify:FL=1|tara:strand:- start:947 stop:1252 length:306 start_codon:yes stop_codon:yes gene_type:complete
MNIITSLPRYSDGEVNRAFMREIMTGLKFEKATEESRTNIARKEAAELKGKEHPVLGKPVAVMPHREFFRLTKKYGNDTVHSKEFIQDYNKRFKDLSPNNA